MCGCVGMLITAENYYYEMVVPLAARAIGHSDVEMYGVTCRTQYEAKPSYDGIWPSTRIPAVVAPCEFST